MKIQNILNTALAAGVGGVALSKGAAAAAMPDRFEIAQNAPAPVAPRAPVVNNARITYETQLVWGPGCGSLSEVVNFDVTAYAMYHDVQRLVNDDQNVTMRFMDHLQWWGSGVGVTTGNTYQFSDVITDHGQATYAFFPPDYLETYSVVANGKITERGKGLVAFEHLTIKYAFDSIELIHNSTTC